MRKNGKSKVPRLSHSTVSNSHPNNGRTKSRSPNGSVSSLSSHSDGHRSRKAVDPANNRHSLEEDERVEPEEADLLQEEGIFELAYGYIHFGEGKPKKAKSTPLPDENSPLDRQESDEESTPGEPSKNGGGGPSFRFVGRNCQNSINLFGNQMFKLVRELRNAYKAYRQSDDSYQFVVVENNEKNHRVTLEVSLYQEKTYLFLKRYFKNRDGYRSFGRNTDPDAWLPAKGVVSLDPNQDDPAKMLRYVLRCCQ